MTNYASGVSGASEDLCRYLAACYYEPAVEFAEERLFESIRAAAGAIDPGLGEAAKRLGAAFAATDLQTLLVDHTRLFIGPTQPVAMPYASFWLTDDQSQRHDATMAILDMYADGGFDVSDELRELPDHIAVELEFLYQLIYAGNAQARGEAAADAALYRRFVVDHLGVWIPKFAAAMDAGAETAFYKELAGITASFVRLERGRAEAGLN